MPFEEIEVRITKSGEIYVKIEGSHEERVRDYFSFLEETVGPARPDSPARRSDWDRPGNVAAGTDGEEYLQPEQELRF